MKKRPLCVAALLAVLLLWALPAGIWMKDDFPDTGPGWPEAVVGEVESTKPSSAGGRAVYLSHSNVSETGRVLVYLKADASFSVGNLIQTVGKLKIKEPDVPTNPGQFDARLYYQTEGVTLIAYADSAKVLDGRVRPVPNLLQRIPGELGERCTRLLGASRGGVFRAMVLGDKGSLDPEMKSLYQQSGMSHLLAISGLHISIFGMGFYRLLRRLGCSFPAAGLPAMGFLLLYGLMTGMSTSTARAVFMFLLAVGADLLGRSYDLLTALSCAALLLLAEQPLYARSASFLLSFGAVMGIGVVYPALLSLYPAKRRRSQALLLSLAVQGVTLPLSLFFFYELPLYGILVNLVAIPLMTALLFLGTGAILLSYLSFRAAQLPAFFCALILRLYEGLGAFSLRLPGAVQIFGRPRVWQLFLYGAGLAGLLIWRYRTMELERWRKTKAALLGEEERESKTGTGRERLREQLVCAGVYGALLLILLLRFPYRGLTFTMLDVGQGDALFLRTEAGTTYLIDGGSSSVSSVGAYRVFPFLKEQGIRRLDYVAVTHLDGDHVSGIRELLEEAGGAGGIRIGTLLLTEAVRGEETEAELLALAEKCGTEVYRMKRGDILSDGQTRITCLHPGIQKVYADKNTASLVLGVEYGKFSLLLTGDLDEEGEKEILEEVKSLSGMEWDVLKVGHHGSRSSTSEAWLEQTRPKLALISAGADNRYGHPNPETLERLQRAGCKILQTTESGAITIRADGEKMWIETYK